MTWHTPEEAAKILRLPEHWDGARWVRRHCKSGDIKGKQISRGVWRISDAALAAFMEPAEEVEKVAPVEEPPVEPIDFMSGLAPRARKRVRSA